MKIPLIALSLALSWTQQTGALEKQDDADSEHGGHSFQHHTDQPEVKHAVIQPTITETVKTEGEHQGMHHDAMPAMNQTNGIQAKPHSGHDRPQESTNSVPAGHLNHPGQGADQPSHAALSMQGGSAPADARDPHAYSDGYGFGPLPPPTLNDEENFAGLLVDRLESLSTGDNTFMTYDLQGWYGKNDNRALIRAEGDIDAGSFQNARSELLWAHAADAYWDTHLGVRYDKGLGPDRGWLAVGVQGLAPYWIYLEATAYVGEQGRTAFRIETEYDILLTQKLVLQPRIEANFYGKSDIARSLGHGLSDLAAGARLHYEIRRELAPYIGIEWASKFGGTADYLRTSGNRIDETRAVAGVQFWF